MVRTQLFHGMKITEAEIKARLRDHAADLDGSRSGAQPGDEWGTPNPRCAAVLVPLFTEAAQLQVLLTRRTTRVESHKGQVSFPGGACDPGEVDPETTALREAEEELGLRPADVRILGRLAPLLTISNYLVTPVVGAIPWPYVFRVANAEVDRVFAVPIAWLADPMNRWEIQIPGSAQPLQFFQPYDGELLWGVSARIAADLIHIVGPPQD